MRILHLFNWPLKDINYNLDKIASQNFNAIQINPIQPLKEDGYKEWWMSYQPCSFKIGNIYGSKEELIELCKHAKEKNLMIFADVVCNHMAGSIFDDLVPHEKVDKNLTNNPNFWKVKKNIYNWNNRNEVINYCMNLPGLNLSNKELQKIIIEFLYELLDCGIEGFRFDAAKTIALPEEGNDFFSIINSNFKNMNIFMYGEVIFASYDLIEKYSKYIKVLTDYSNNDEDKVVRFVESHDTYLSNDNLGYTKRLASSVIAQNYNNLSSNYSHTIFYARPYDDTWQSSIISSANKKIIKK